MSFVNKVILITGGSSGIGAATAIEFTKEGANVVIVGRNEEKLNSVIEKCTNAGKKPLSIKADITHEEEAEIIIKKTIDTFGKIDVLVNNAGLVRYVNILDKDKNILENYDLTMNTNLRAQIYLTHLAGPFLIKSKGNIINISSIVPKTRPIYPYTLILYGISKAAFTQFSRAAAAEFAPHGVRVNTVSPGLVETDILNNAGIDITFSDLVKNFPMPLDRISESKEIADMILYIASDKAKGMTGTEHIIDNGYLLKY